MTNAIFHIISLKCISKETIQDYTLIKSRQFKCKKSLSQAKNYCSSMTKYI